MRVTNGKLNFYLDIPFIVGMGKAKHRKRNPSVQACIFTNIGLYKEQKIIIKPIRKKSNTYIPI